MEALFNLVESLHKRIIVLEAKTASQSKELETAKAALSQTIEDLGYATECLEQTEQVLSILAKRIMQ